MESQLYLEQRHNGRVGVLGRHQAASIPLQFRVMD